MGYVFKMMDSPVGELRLIASDKGLSAVQWTGGKRKQRSYEGLVREDNHPVLVETERQLKEYFAGTRQVFKLTLDPMGTEFQRSVWGELVKIPFGETRSYGELAKGLGNAQAMRAVGAANGQNPIPLIVPCHRVVGGNGKLTGFAGGLERKAWLLAHEGRQAPGSLFNY